MSISKLNFRTAHRRGDRIRFDSVGIDLVCEYLSLEHETKPGALDFAPADNNLIQHFADCNCIYYAAPSIFDEFLSSQQYHLGDELDSGLSKLMKNCLDKQKRIGKDDNANDPVGAILVWDLFNYIGREKIIRLMASISPLCRKGARLWALIWLTEKIPSLPGRFTMTTDRKVVYEYTTSEMVSTSSLAAQTVVSMMPSFKPHRMSASDTGILEVILEFDTLVDPPDSNLISSSQLTGFV